MNVYLIRHGQTQHNVENVFQPSEIGLSDNGLKQSQLIAQRFKSIPIDLIVASPHQRARQTAEIVGKAINKKVTYSDLFVERRMPSEIIDKSTNDPKILEIENLIWKNYQISDWRYSDEESFEEIKKRAISALTYLIDLNTENVLVVTHGDMLRALIGAMMFGEDLTAEKEYRLLHFMMVGNTGLTLCKYEQDMWKLFSWNDQIHLGE